MYCNQKALPYYFKTPTKGIPSKHLDAEQEKKVLQQYLFESIVHRGIMQKNSGYLNNAHTTSSSHLILQNLITITMMIVKTLSYHLTHLQIQC